MEQGQGLLSGLPSNYLNPNPSYYDGTTFIIGLLNTNGYAAISVGLALATDPSAVYSTAYAVPPGSNGELAWGQIATIASDPSDYKATGLMTIAGINTSNQALVGTTYADQAYNSLVYNFATNTTTNLETLPQVANGTFSNLIPLAIDNQGQILSRCGHRRIWGLGHLATHAERRAHRYDARAQRLHHLGTHRGRFVARGQAPPKLVVIASDRGTLDEVQQHALRQERDVVVVLRVTAADDRACSSTRTA